MSVQLERHPQGVVLPVRAQPGAKRNGIRGVHQGMLKVTVTQIAEKGKANQAILEVLCKALDLRKSQVVLVAGETSQQKRFLIRDVNADDLAARIAAAMPS